MVEQAAKDYAGKLKIVSANVADTGDTASGLGIFSIPTLVFYKAGKEVGRTVGAISRAKLGKEIASKLGVA